MAYASPGGPQKSGRAGGDWREAAHRHLAVSPPCCEAFRDFKDSSSSSTSNAAYNASPCFIRKDIEASEPREPSLSSQFEAFNTQTLRQLSHLSGCMYAVALLLDSGGLLQAHPTLPGHCGKFRILVCPAPSGPQPLDGASHAISILLITVADSPLIAVSGQ